MDNTDCLCTLLYRRSASESEDKDALLNNCLRLLSAYAQVRLEAMHYTATGLGKNHLINAVENVEVVYKQIESDDKARR